MVLEVPALHITGTEVCVLFWYLILSDFFFYIFFLRFALKLMSHCLHITCRFPKTVPPKFHSYLSYELHVQSITCVIYFFCGAAAPRVPWPPYFFRFLVHSQRRITLGRTPLDEWSARRRDLYPTTHITHNRQTCMTPVGFEPTISAGERPQTYALDRAATGTGCA